MLFSVHIFGTMECDFSLVNYSTPLSMVMSSITSCTSLVKHVVSQILKQRGRISEVRIASRNFQYMIAMATHHQSID